jgi:hypothetical protein
VKTTAAADLLQILLVTYLVSDVHYLKKKNLISDAPKDLENGASGTKQVDKAEAGTAEYLIELEERRSIKVNTLF